VSGQDFLAPRSAFVEDRSRGGGDKERALSDKEIAGLIDDIASPDPALAQGARAVALRQGGRIVSGLLGLLDDSSPKRRKAAVILLGDLLDRLTDPATLLQIEMACERKAVDDDDSDVREQATLVMGRFRIVRTKRSLLRMMIDDTQAERRKHAVQSLAGYDSEGIAEALQKAFDAESDLSVRIAIAESLSKVGSVPSLDFLSGALNHKDFLFRHDAVQALGAIAARLTGDLRQTAEQMLLKVLAGDGNPYVRGAAARAFGGLLDSRDLGAIIRALSEAAKDKNAFVYMSAVRSLNALRASIEKQARRGSLADLISDGTVEEWQGDMPPAGGGKPDDGRGGTGQIGKGVSVVSVKDNFAVVRLSGGVMQSVPLEYVRPLEVSEAIANVRQIRMSDEGAKCTLLCMLGLLDDMQLELYQFGALPNDLFGFAAPAKRMIALQKGVVQDPVALLHEMCEYLVSVGLMQISLENGDIVLTGPKGRSIGRIAVTSDDARRQLAKIEENPALRRHYLLRAFARQTLGDRDRMFSALVKSLRAAGAKESGVFSVADDAVPWGAAKEVVDVFAEIASADEGGMAGEAARAITDVVLFSRVSHERAGYAMEAFFGLLLSGGQRSRGLAVRELGRIAYVNDRVFGSREMERICGALISAKDRRFREEAYISLIEPLFFKRPDLFTPSIMERLANAYAGVPVFKYLSFYGSLRGAPAADGSMERFGFQERFRSVMGTGPRKVLVVHNIDDGFGDELIRLNTMIEGLLHYNPQLRVDVYTKRLFLYKHPRVTARDIGQFDPESGEKHDMVVDYFSPYGTYDQHVEDRVQDYIYGARPPIVAYAGMSMWDFSFQGVFIGSSLVEMPYDRSENAYAPMFRLCAELGIPFREGTVPPREPLLVNRDNPAGERYWDTTVERLRGGKPVVAFNGLGGEAEDKGFSRKPEDQRRFLDAMRELIERDLFVVLLPNETKWGSNEHLTSLVDRLPPEQRAQVVVAPPLAQNRDVMNYVVDRADLVVTTEGGQMHYAYSLGKPFVVFRMPGTASMSNWVPMGTDPCQVAVNADTLIGDGVDRVLLAMQARGGAAGVVPHVDAALQSLEAAAVSP